MAPINPIKTPIIVKMGNLKVKNWSIHLPTKVKMTTNNAICIPNPEYFTALFIFLF
jgi:hypothetical protein